MAAFSLREELNRFWKQSDDSKDERAPTPPPRPARSILDAEKAGMDDKTLYRDGRLPATPMSQGLRTGSKFEDKSEHGGPRNAVRRDYTKSFWAQTADHNKRPRSLPRPWPKGAIPPRSEWQGSRMARRRSRSRGRDASKRRGSRSSSSCSSRHSSPGSVKRPVTARRASRWDELPAPQQRWDQPPAPQQPPLTLEQASVLRSQGLGGFDQFLEDEQSNFTRIIQEHNPAMMKKRRELYLGNLPKNESSMEMLVTALRSIFDHIPEFQLRYPDRPDVVRSVCMPPSSQGTFAFVEMHDEVIASTVLAMSGFEVCGRSVKVRRPTGYTTPGYGELPILDVGALRNYGLIPMTPNSDDKHLNSDKEVYFGNLLAGSVTQDVMRSLLMPVLDALGKTTQLSVAERARPILKVTLTEKGTYCFVQFSNRDLASKIIPVFDGTELFGRKIRVGRPSHYAGPIENGPFGENGRSMEDMVAVAVANVNQIPGISV